MAEDVLIAGIDEAGRGPLAGPVIAAAVIISPGYEIAGLMDSKKLNASRRNSFAAIIREQALAVGIGRSEVDEIDRINILQATLLAMRRAFADLGVMPDKVLIDGNISPVLPCAVETIVKGDNLKPVISAASIIAKVARDYDMEVLDNNYPGYGFAQNKGYPTRNHIQALKKKGPCPIHRHSFKPVTDYINN